MPATPETMKAPEGASRLEAIEVDANKVGEAMEKAGASAAGQTEWDWVLNPEHSAQAALMLTGGDFYFFPGAVDPKHKERALCVYRDDNGIFKKDFNLRKHVWNSFDRIVIKS